MGESAPCEVHESLRHVVTWDTNGLKSSHYELLRRFIHRIRLPTSGSFS